MNNTIDKLINGEIPMDFNWNTEEHPDVPLPKTIPPEPTPEQIQKAILVSEDLRDGLHGVSEYPSAREMLHFVSTINEFGMDNMTVGIFPGEGTKISKTIKKLLTEMYEKFPNITPNVLCLATESSIKWTLECKKLNPNLQALVFMGSAPSRMLAQDWTQELVIEKLAWATQEVAKHNIPVIGATEHTTQTPPAFLKKIIETVVSNGAKTFCIADTIGTARPIGVYRIVKFTRNVLEDMGAGDVLIDWHGHRDMGNDIANAMTALAAGANRIHTVARGIGERAGNTPLEAMVLNFDRILEEHGQRIKYNTIKLSQVLEEYSKLVKLNNPSHGPLSERAFRTSLGIHSDAINKALSLSQEAYAKNQPELGKRLEDMSRRIYTAVDPQSVGRKHEIMVGPWSGKSTITLAAKLNLGVEPETISEEQIEHIQKTAKGLGRELTNKELKRLLSSSH